MLCGFIPVYKLLKAVTQRSRPGRSSLFSALHGVIGERVRYCTLLSTDEGELSPRDGCSAYVKRFLLLGSRSEQWTVALRYMSQARGEARVQAFCAPQPLGSIPLNGSQKLQAKELHFHIMSRSRRINLLETERSGY